MLLGSHVSIAGGFDRAIREARELRCETFQIFSGSKMQWHTREIGDEEARDFRAGVRSNRVAATMIHDSYLINLASPEPLLHGKSMHAFAAEMRRADRLGVPHLVFHPGAHKGDGEAAGLRRIIDSLNRLLRDVRGRVTLLFENTAGQGTALGYRLEHLAELLAGIRRRRRVGICIDTCHLLAADYDLRTPRAYEATMGEIERVIGLEAVRAFHLNDSKGDLGCRVDRHAEIGAGAIGSRVFGRLVRDERFRLVPGVLETPGGLAGFRRNLRHLKRLRGRRPEL